MCHSTIRDYEWNSISPFQEKHSCQGINNSKCQIVCVYVFMCAGDRVRERLQMVCNRTIALY